jgi:hypothetical protein
MRIVAMTAAGPGRKLDARMEKTLPLVRVQSSAEVNTFAVLRLEPEPIWLPLMKRT